MGQEQKTPHSCIADTPLNGKDDHLDADIYARALANFIRHTDTPFTIGIQGGWGSGKTSLFSLIKARLQPEAEQKGASWKAGEQKDTSGKDAEQKIAAGKDEEKQPIPCIAVNAWEQSLFQDDAGPVLVAVNLLQDIITKIHELPQDSRLKLGKETEKKLIACEMDLQGTLATLRRVVLATAQIGLTLLTQKDMSGAVKLATGAGDPGPGSPAAQVRNLRTKLADLVGCLPAVSGTVRLVIFIDDLDRVPPPTAVEILDVLKNIFNIPGCVFVLAVDYDVVIKGLEAKLGPRTGKNTHEFRQYLDKIIQVPFTMPVGVFSQNNGKFIRHLFEKVLPREISEDSKKSLEEIFRLATGGNPRSVKRIINTFLLLEHIQAEKSPTLERNIRKLPLEACVLVVGLHLNFPEICGRLAERPDFTKWSLVLGESWNLNFEQVEKKLSVIEQNPELETYFNEEWQKVVYCLCAKTDWLKRNVVNIVRLLLLLRQLIHKPEDAEVGGRDKLPLASVLALRSFIEDIRIFSEKDAGEADDYVTNYMYKVYDRLKGKFPELGSDSLSTQIVVEEISDKREPQGNNDIVHINRIYTFPIEGKFKNFLIQLYNHLDTIHIKYSFEFTFLALQNEIKKELIERLIREAEANETSDDRHDAPKNGSCDAPDDGCSETAEDTESAPNEDEQGAYPDATSSFQEEFYNFELKGEGVFISLDTNLLDEADLSEPNVRGCVRNAEKAYKFALKVRQAFVDHAQKHPDD